jgi:hypothetical protein
MHTHVDITELRVPISKATYQALEGLKERLKRERCVRRVTTRDLVREALDLLFETYGDQNGTTVEHATPPDPASELEEVPGG